jgi:hypothetical protein
VGSVAHAGAAEACPSICLVSGSGGPRWPVYLRDAQYTIGPLFRESQVRYLGTKVGTLGGFFAEPGYLIHDSANGGRDGDWLGGATRDIEPVSKRCGLAHGRHFDFSSW